MGGEVQVSHLVYAEVGDLQLVLCVCVARHHRTVGRQTISDHRQSAYLLRPTLNCYAQSSHTITSDFGKVAWRRHHSTHQITSQHTSNHTAHNTQHPLVCRRRRRRFIRNILRKKVSLFYSFMGRRNKPSYSYLYRLHISSAFLFTFQNVTIKITNK